jgi:hypothetical protein
MAQIGKWDNLEVFKKDFPVFNFQNKKFLGMKEKSIRVSNKRTSST